MNSPLAVTIVLMGDSITEGQYVEPGRRWSSIVTDRLVRAYLQTPVNFLVVVRGVSGETTRQGLERFPRDVQAHEPDVMTLQFGFNDCNCWVTDRGLPRVSEGAYRANLVEMIDRARRFGARQIILSTNHPTLRHKILLSNESLETRRKRYNEMVRDVAREVGVTLCDVDQAFAGSSWKELELLLIPYPDHLHLSAKGHEFYAETIYPFLDRAVEQVVAERRHKGKAA